MHKVDKSSKKGLTMPRQEQRKKLRKEKDVGANTGKVCTKTGRVDCVCVVKLDSETATRTKDRQVGRSYMF